MTAYVLVCLGYDEKLCYSGFIVFEYRTYLPAIESVLFCSDKHERPELCLGTYEFVATKDYCRYHYSTYPATLFY